MNQLFVKSKWTGLLGTALMLVACGGSGSGNRDSSFIPPDINETPVAITVDNQNAVALTADESVSGATAGGSDFALGVVVDGGGPSTNIFNLTSTTLLDYVKQGVVAGADLPAGVVQSDTINCDSGSITLTIDMADPNSGILVAGDSASITVNNCTNTGTTINGSYSLTIDSGSIDTNCASSCVDDFTSTVSFNNLRVTELGSTATIHGGITLVNSDTSGTASFSGTSLFLIAGTDAIHLTDFSVSSSTTGAITSTTVNMTVAGTQINGSITIVTTDPLLQNEFDIHPHGGTIVVTGAGGATLTIVYLNATQVELTLDPDGAGPTLANTPVVVAWADM